MLFFGCVVGGLPEVGGVRERRGGAGGTLLRGSYIVSSVRKGHHRGLRSGSDRHHIVVSNSEKNTQNFERSESLRQGAYDRIQPAFI